MIGGNVMLTIWLWMCVGSFIISLAILWKWYRPEDMSKD